MGIEKMNAGLLLPKNTPDSNYLCSLECADPQYEDTLTSLASSRTDDSEVIKPGDKNWGISVLPHAPLRIITGLSCVGRAIAQLAKRGSLDKVNGFECSRVK